MKHKKFSSIVLILLLIFSRASIAEESPVVGAIIPLSGPFARIGTLIQRGVTEGSGANVKVTFEDEKCDALQTVTAFKALSGRGIKLFLGPCCGSPQAAVAPLLKSSDSFSLLISSASRTVFSASSERMFSAQFSIEDEATFLAKKLFEDGYKKVGLLFTESDFSRSHEKAFRETFQGIALPSLTYPQNDTSGLRSAVLKIKAQKPDALFVPDVSPLLLGLMRELIKLGLSNLPVVSIYAANSPDVITAGGLENGMLSVSYPDIGDEDALIYYPRLGAKMLSNAVSECGSDTTCIKSFLRKNYDFDEFGTLRGKFIFKNIREKKT